ncbi:MAG: peptidase M22 [Oscillospiraceae bacterium]
MPQFLGLDTSNYTTSAAVFDSDANAVFQCKKLLPVKDGELGLRQSDAVFHHTAQLSGIISELFETADFEINSVGVSTKPRSISGSYMPCFLVGKTVAMAISAVKKIPCYETSHQVGHILAALFSAKKMDLIAEKFIAFHVSGGTTDCLLVEPNADEIIKITEISTSLDLKAGQAVDRVGIMLGLHFPCGIELEKIAQTSTKNYKIKPTLKNGNCCLSGVENLCKKMLNDGENPQDIAKFCLDYIAETLALMTKFAQKTFGNLPIVFAGGVMSDTIIRKRLQSEFSANFAEPAFSCDNAVGTAIFAALKRKDCI